MRTLLHELEARADLVIVDTAATLAVSDSLPLIQSASGITMIVRMNRSSRAGVRRLQKVIAAAHGNVMGVVATSAGSTTYGYGESYYQRQNGSGTAKRSLVRRLRRSADAPSAPAEASQASEAEREELESGVVAPEPAPEPVRAMAPEPARAAVPSRFPPAAPVSSYVPPTAPAPWSVARAAPARAPATGRAAWRRRLSDAAHRLTTVRIDR
jgi:hypothetical protein